MDLYVSKTICLLVSLSLITIFLSFSNNAIIYGQVINNSAHDNSIENSTAITSGNSQDKSDKEIRNDKIVREFYSNVFFAKNASAAVNYLEEDYVNTIQMSQQEERPSLTHLHKSLSKTPNSIHKYKESTQMEITS